MLVLFCKAVESLAFRAYLVNIGHFRVDHRISPRLPMLDTSRAVLGDKPLLGDKSLPLPNYDG